MARCYWRRSAYISGDGPYAVITCSPNRIVYLFATRGMAEYEKTLIDRHGCGEPCYHRHKIEELVLSEQPVTIR